jgi:hypothetical protein
MAKPPIPAPSKTKSPIGPGSGYLQSPTSAQTPKTPKAPKAPKAPVAPVVPVDPQVALLQAELERIRAQAALNAAEAEREAASRRQQRVNAFDLLKNEFSRLGLGDFAPLLEGYIKQDVDPSVATILLESTDVYQQRFKGNLTRRQKGLPELGMESYINAEQEYRQLLKSTGLNALDNKDTYAALIGGDVSLSEAQDRIEKVYQKIDNADALVKNQINKYFTQYGVSDPTVQKQQVALAILGGQQAASTLQKSLQKAQLRAGAEFAGVTVAEATIEELQKQTENVSDVYGLAKQGFSTLAQTQAETERLSSIYNQETTASELELEQEAFFGLESQRRKKLKEKEKATFGGQAGTSTVSLAQKSSAGQF